MKKTLLTLGSSIGILLLLFVFSPNRAFSQANDAVTISGTVTSAKSGEGIPGVNIVVKGTGIGTATDVSGSFTLEVPSLQDTLVFSFVGYKTRSIPINGRTTINVTLQPKSIALQEVVVTALGIEQEKKSLSYSVEEVSGEAITSVPLTNAINALNGLVAGVTITPNTGGPGSSSRVIIRGSTSLTGSNQPLYVIDGVPINNSKLGSTTGDIANYSRSNYGSTIGLLLNPDNIKSITVLKGPNAAALYGARAANGVIMITTKKGYAREGIGVSYSGSFTWKTPMVLPDYQNQYGQGTNGRYYSKGALQELKNASGSWGGRFDGKNHLYWTGEVRPYVAQPNNVKNFFRTAGTFSNSIAFAGGSESATFRLSYTHMRANSMLPNSTLEGHHFNLRASASLTDNLHINGKVTYAIQHNEHRIVQGTEGIMSSVLDMPRNIRLTNLKNYQDDEGYDVRTYSDQSIGNPYWTLFRDINQNTKRSILGFLKVEYDFTSSLSAYAEVTTNYNRQGIYTVTKTGHWFFPKGNFSRRKFSTSETNAKFLVKYNKAFTENFSINLKVGGNHRYITYKSVAVTGSDFKLPTVFTLANASELSSGVTPLREKIVNSLYGTATLSYNDTYFLNVTGRNDWSSTLPRGNWSYFYPSIGASMLISEFIDPEHEVINLWKVRASWAQVGNDTAPYQLTNSYNIVQEGYLGLTVLTLPSLLLDTSLKPETVTSWEVGTNIELFNSRLHASFTYYSIESQNLIIDVPLAAGVGYSSFRTNVGRITNKGIEVEIGGTPILSNDFSWNISLNFARNNSKLVNLTEQLERFTFSTTNSGNVTVLASVGGGYGEIWGTTYRRTPEGKLIVDASGLPLPSNELVQLGNYQADYTGGLLNTFNYKNFTFSFLIDATIGGEMYIGTQRYLDIAGVSQKTLQYRKDGVIVEGVINKGTAENPKYVENTERITAQQYWSAYGSIASNYVKDKTNIRLREVSLNYSFSPELLANTPISAASIGIVGRNLFFIYSAVDNFDPESSYSSTQFGQGVLFFNLPTTTQFGFNINLKF